MPTKPPSPRAIALRQIDRVDGIVDGPVAGAPLLQPIPQEILSDYMALITRHPLTSILDDEGHAAAIAMLDEIIDIPRPTEGQELYMAALGDLVHSYESRIYAHPRIPSKDRLKTLIEFKGVTQTEVHESTGIAHSTISEILSGRRKVSRKAIAAFAAYFKVEPSFFLD